MAVETDSKEAQLEAELRARTAELERLRESAAAQQRELLMVTANLRSARDEARLANAAKSSFVAVMSHELRTPLNAIIGFSDIIEKEMFGPLGNEKYGEYIRDIGGSAEHLLSLINDILDLSKIEAGRYTLEEDHVDVAEAVETSLRFVRERAMTHRVKLAVDLPPVLPRVVADRRAVRQVLLNLLSNGIKFTPEGGNVTVRVQVEAARGMVISVVDSGVGIAAGDLETALAPFGQVDSTHARNAEGTGLGLPLSKQLMELHGGRLELESEPGKGTEVRAILPAERIIAGYAVANEA